MKPFSLATSTSYLRGQFVPFAEANVSIASSPFLYGLAIYTVFSANWNDEHEQLYVFRLRDHYERLCASARIMDFQDFAARYSYEQFENLMLDLLRRNNVRQDALVRAMVFVDELAAGTRIHGLRNELAVYVYAMGEILPLSGVHAGVSSWQRTPDNELYIADEALFVGSSARITPILSVDHRPVGQGSAGPITRRLAQHYAALQHGETERTHHWLTPVYPG
jgi:branched-subunit amino acid aminotransferase/4-amino-4-deoxychorismate lyase